jgi:hypothetical protein
MMMDSNNANAITIIKDSTLPVSLPSSPSTIKITINKDERLEHLDIPKGLIELLQINGLTVEKNIRISAITNCENNRYR